MSLKSYLVKDVFYTLCEMTDTPYALTAALLLKSSDKEFLAQLKAPVPKHYLSISKFAKDYQVYNYLRKWVGLEGGVDKELVALQKWRDAEERCHDMNKRLDTPSFFENDVERAIQRARRKIARVLGEFSYSKVLKGAAMGPGATYDLRRVAEPGSKLHLPISVTPSCKRYAKAWLEHDIHWAFAGTGVVPVGSYSLLDSNFIVAPGNKLITVAKDSSTDRVICIEPTFNLFLQKGVGSYMRSKLKKFGVDLDDQSRNQELAHSAFSLGYATIDLSSASDTICSSLIKLLLPLDWWLFLDDIRSKLTRLPDGEWHRNAKWSSMGNGFTFELESMIFWALAPECDVISVYGDDIICNQGAADEYITILSAVGFTTNVAKSYVDGEFFESCGKHFFQGIEVTPCYQKESISSALSFTRAHNRLKRANMRMALDSPFTARQQCCNMLIARYPYQRKPFVPLHADDRGFITANHRSWIRDLNRGIKCPVLKTSPFLRKAKQDGLYVTKLHQPSSVSYLSSDGRMPMTDEGSRVRLSTSWIQPFVLTNVWVPKTRIISRVDTEDYTGESRVAGPLPA